MLPSQIVQQGWCKGANARDKNEVITDMDSDNARFLCARSAVMKAFKRDIMLENIYIGKIYEKTVCSSITSWNDDKDRTIDEVVHLFEEIEKELELV